MSKKVFDDGSSVEWTSRESLRYTEGHLSVSIGVDFEEGWFKSGRIVRTGTIRSWEGGSSDEASAITEEKKKEIIDKVVLYYKHFRKKVVLQR